MCGVIEKVGLSIVIPVYNSEKSIKHLVDELFYLYNDKLNFEIILVDDASSDLSLLVCNTLQKTYSHIKVFSHSKNYGQQKALFTGLKNCCGEFVLVMDDDLQNPPSEVLTLFKALQENQSYDVVVGSRKQNHQPLVKKLLSTIKTKVYTSLTGQKIVLNNFFIMRESVVQAILKKPELSPLIQGIILSLKVPITSANVQHAANSTRKSNYSFFKTIKHIAIVISVIIKQWGKKR